MIYENYENIIITGLSIDTYDDIINRWNEPHRFYHNINHLNYILYNIEKAYVNGIITTPEKHTLIVVAFLHDIIYNPKANDNEEKSVEYFVEKCKIINVASKEFIEDVSRIIMDTKKRIKPTEKLSKIFWEIDNSILDNDINKLIEYEHQIFKEYQWVSYDVYKENRIKFLESSLGRSEQSDRNLKELIEYVKNRVINVGVYAGSFNPFHIGHNNILQKAMMIFDKVIVAFGVNPEKEKSENIYPDCLDFIETIEYNGLVTDMLNDVESKGCNVTLLRGIRNGADLSYESNQLSFIRDIRPNTRVIFIPADKEFEHISSSAIRSLMKFDVEAAKKYLV